jgi:hypothetical protein
LLPPAGVTARFDGEWTGVWENYVVRWYAVDGSARL